MDNLKRNGQSDPQIEGLSQSPEGLFAIRLSPDEAAKVMDSAMQAAWAFGDAGSGSVPEPEKKWKVLDTIFRNLIDASGTGDAGLDAVSDQVIITRSGPPQETEWTLRLLCVIPKTSADILILSSPEKSALNRAQVLSGPQNWVIDRGPDGWNVSIQGPEKGARFGVNLKGEALDMRPDAVMERDGIPYLEYQAGFDPELRAELDNYKKHIVENREKIESPPGIARSGPRPSDLKAAFSDIDRAEKKRQEDLRKRREELERKAKEAQTPPPSKEPEPVASSPERREDRGETGVSETPKLCVHCGDTLIEGKSFCASCGRPVPKEPEPPEPEPEPLTPETCIHCGAELPLGKNFCPDCGTPISGAEPETEITAPPPTVRPAPPPPEPPAQEPITIRAVEVCPQCHAVLKPHAKFCRGCGAELKTEAAPKMGVAPPPPASPLKPPSDACPHCGKALNPGAKFCTGCGKSVPLGRPAPPFGAQPTLQTSKCPGCGGSLKAGARFCTKCGRSLGPGPQPQAPPPPTAKAAAPGKARKEKQPKQRRMGPGMMDTAMTFAPGLILDFTRRWPLYQQEPQMAMTMILPCVMSFLSVGLAPKLGKWFAIVLILISLGWLVYPMFGGGGFGEHAGRGLVGGSFIYTIMRLIRMVRR